MPFARAASDSQAVANLLWALAKMGSKPDTRLLEAMQGRATVIQQLVARKMEQSADDPDGLLVFSSCREIVPYATAYVNFSFLDARCPASNINPQPVKDF